MTTTHSHGAEHSDTHQGRPTLAVWKFASCDGCQLTLLNCEDELIPLAGEVEIAYFPEATRAVVEGPYDVSLVEGSVTTPEEIERIQHVRAVSRRLITIGACATAGGIQALRNFGDVAEFRSIVYAHPEYLSPCPGRRRSRRTSPSTSSCVAAPSTSTSCSRSSPPRSRGASRGCPPTVSAWSASAAGTSA